MGGSRLHEFFLKRSSPQRIGDVGQRDCVGVDASWMMQRYLQPHKSDIQKGRIIRAVLEFIRRVENLEKVPMSPKTLPILGPRKVTTM